MYKEYQVTVQVVHTYYLEIEAGSVEEAEADALEMRLKPDYADHKERIVSCPIEKIMDRE